MHNNSSETLQWFDEPLVAAWPSRQADWQSLATRYSHPEVVSARFVDTVVRTLFRDQKDLRLLTCVCNGVPEFMAIGRHINFHTFSLFQPSQTPIALVLARDGLELQKFCQYFLRNRSFAAIRFEIYQIDSMYYGSLRESPCVDQIEHIQVPFVDYSSSYDSYYSALSKNFRANCRKQRNKLDALGVSYQLKIVVKPDEIDEALSLYSRLELGGWKLGKGTAVDEATGQLDFYRALLKSYSTSGCAQVAQFWIKENGVARLVASDICILCEKTAYMLKTAYDESLRGHETLSSLTPAALMHEDLFRYWIDELGINRLEFYGKTLDWHLRWTNSQRPLYNLSIFRSNAAKMIFFQLKKLQKLFR